MTDDIGHRHALPASGLGPADAAEPLSVLVSVPAHHAGWVSAQLTASCLVNLVSRQVGTVRQIWIRCPTVKRSIPLPNPAAPSELGPALEELARWTTGGRIPASLIDGPAPKADVELHIGRFEVPGSQSGRRLVALADGWRAWIGRPEAAPQAHADNPNPLGPFLAACLAAGEVFKISRGITRGRLFDALALSLWTGEAAADWGVLRDGPPVEGHALPPMHVVGAGAVGQALAYVLRNARLAEAYIAVIDHDEHDGTNLNRCFLAGRDDVTDKKVAAIKRYEGDGLSVYAFGDDLAAYLTSPRSQLDPRLARQADSGDYRVVVSCVDRGYSRQQVQSLRPQVIFGGSTMNLVARANVYRPGSGRACLGCHNPAEREADKIWALRQELAGLTPQGLSAFLLERGIDPAAVAEELARPTCGSDGEKAITDLARPPPAFSVGFVSLAAGLLLASNLLRDLAFAADAPAQRSMISLPFLTGDLDQSDLSIDDHCEQRCADR